MPYGEVPGFAQSTAPGHAGRFVAGRLAGKPVLCMQGRLHFYEGHPMQAIAFPIRVMKELGGAHPSSSPTLPGGVNTSFSVGDLTVIEDHINFMGQNPLTGPNDEAIGPAFMRYDLRLHPAPRQLAFQVLPGRA